MFSLVTAGTAYRSESDFHPEYVNSFLHRASTFALFDSKASKVLPDLPRAESLRYKACKRVVKNVLDMAKCVVKLLDKRDILIESKVHDEDKLKDIKRNDECDGHDDNGDGSWLRAIFSMVYRSVMCKEKSTDAPTRTQFTRSRPVKIRRLLVFKNPTATRQAIPQQAKETRRRRKRVVNYRRIFNVSRVCDTPSSVKALRNVQKYFDQMNHVIRYTYNVRKENERFFKTANLTVSFKNKAPSGDSPYEQMQKTISEMENFDDKGVVSILSPKLFNVLRASPLDPDSKNYLSPNILSFQDDGVMPLPRLFQWSKYNCETQKWVELLLNMTGGEKLLEQHMAKFGEHMKFVDDTLYPRILEVQNVEKKVEKVHSLTTGEQKIHMEKFGFVEMNKDQLEMAYGKFGINPQDAPKVSNNTDFELERAIRQLAQMSPEELLEMSEEMEGGNHKDGRSKRQTGPPPRRPSIFDFRILNPFGLATRVGNPNLLGNYILSPYAFFAQIFAPYMLGVDVLSPRFMIATIFSPVVLVFRVLSPSAFRLMLFSPLMLIGWVLVPEAFLAKIFSPKLLETRVLSPESFSAIILSPGAGVARIASPNAMNVIVLSPSFFTYGLYSGNRYVLQVLSPGIVGIDAHPLFLPF
ncbi:unnamed protein product [Bursaphelenchus xylophilus]|uniref:(pine wood nematode) hypothetical protein n=1 Tax=Bursaphelenchus xylophilus TaxID=6326 RepID=A0A1I7SX75_BURXY|nr:unnamed protein product [Bursaphelenchus xylophilus]CAG9100232.1 unnamed protein product [Bursaphelenchus xylophilus]